MAVEPYAIAGINTLGNLAATAMTNSANRDIMREQQRWSEEMWQKQNAYNSPIAQMSRLREAGINPALAYASGQPENTATSLPEQAESAKMIPFRFDLDPNMLAQVDLMKSQAHLADSQASYYDEQSKTEGQLRDERLKALQNSNVRFDKDMQKLQKEIDEYTDRHDLSVAQQDQIRNAINIAMSSDRLDWARYGLDYDLTQKQIENLDADTKKKLAERDLSVRELKEMCALFALKKSKLYNEVNLTQAQIDQARAAARKLGFEGDLLAPEAWDSLAWLENLSGKNSLAPEIIALIRAELRDLMGTFGKLLGGFAR